MATSALQIVQRVKADWELAVDSVPQLICVLRKDSVVVRSNKTIEQWGLGKVGEVKGKSLHELMHPDCQSAKCYLKQFLALSKKVIATGEALEYRGLDRILDRNFLIQLVPIGTNVGHMTDHMVIVFQDISEFNLANIDSKTETHWSLIDADLGTKTFSIQKKLAPSQNSLKRNLDVDELDFKSIEKIKLEWESAVDALPQIICLVDEAGAIVRANRAIEQWKVGDVTKVKGRNLHEMLHPDCSNPKCYLKGFNQLITDVLVTDRGTECRELDTKLNRHLHFQINPFSSRQPKQNSLKKRGLGVVLVCDVTDIRQAELKIEHLNSMLEKRIEARAHHLQKINQKLKDEIEQRKLVEMELNVSRQKFSHLVELMNEGMVIQDMERKVTYANRHLLKMLSLPRAEVIGRNFSDFVDIDYIEAWTGGKLKNVKSVESSYVFKLKGRGSKTLWVKGSPQPLYDGAKNCIGSYAVITDINDQIEIEQKLLRTESKLRSLAKQVLFVQELERKRIASELHDGIGQTLSAIKFYVENNISNLNDQTVTSTVKQFETVVPKLQGAIEEVRRISMALRPSLLDDIGVLATLNWFCRESNLGAPNIKFSFDKTNVKEDDISANLKTEMFRIVQEAVNNATKYSKAKNIKLTTKDEAKQLHLEITDDGVGFDYVKIASQQGFAESKGMGLVSMRERVENSGGHFKVNSNAEGGTSIICLWPKEKRSFVDNRSGNRDRRSRKV